MELFLWRLAPLTINNLKTTFKLKILHILAKTLTFALMADVIYLFFSFKKKNEKPQISPCFEHNIIIFAARGAANGPFQRKQDETINILFITCKHGL